jgi:type I restriction enzyme, S subunit
MTGKTKPLPANWRTTTIGSVCSKPQYGWTTSAADSGDVKLLRTTDITRVPLDWSTVPYCRESPAEIEKYLLADGDIVVSRAGSVGVSCRVIAPERAVFASYLIRFRPNDDVDGKYLNYVLQSPAYWAQVRGSTAGIAIPNVNASKLSAFEFPLPPVVIQRRIVAEIEKQFTRLDSGISALRRMQANLKHYRAAVLKAACEGRLVPTEAELARREARGYEPATTLLTRILNERRAEYAASKRERSFTKDDARQLEALPEGWTWAGMRQVGEVQLGRQRAPQHHKGDYMRPYLRVANVFEARIDLRDVNAMNFTPEEFRKYRLVYGDILLNEGQTPELVGRPAMFRDEIPDCCYQKTLIRFRAYSGLLPSFALTVFRSYMHNGRFTRAASITTNIAHLTAEKFVDIEFPLPPFAEQMRIVAEVERRLSVVEELEATISANLQRAGRLRQSILQKAFTGELV